MNFPDGYAIQWGGRELVVFQSVPPPIGAVLVIWPDLTDGVWIASAEAERRAFRGKRFRVTDLLYEIRETGPRRDQQYYSIKVVVAEEKER